MPSIALFIKQLLSEDPRADAGARIDERIAQLNAAQLQGMHTHLTATAKKSRSDMWREANQEMLDRIHDVLVRRTAEDQAERKLLLEMRLKKKQKVQKAREERQERERVLAMIKATAHDRAAQEVKEAEQRRQTTERMEIMHRTFHAEERRHLQWKVIATTYVVMVVGAGVALGGQVQFLAVALAGLTVVAVALAYRAYRVTTIRPTVVSPEDIEGQVVEREDVLRKQALMTLKEKERRFEEQQRRDEEEARKRRRVQRERKRFEATLLEQQRQEQLAMAQEVFERSSVRAEPARGGGTDTGTDACTDADAGSGRNSGGDSAAALRVVDVEAQDLPLGAP